MWPALRVLCIAAAALALCADAAWAEDWIIALDHGQASKERIEAHRTKALRLIDVLKLRGDRVKLIAVGGDASGRSRGRDLRAVVDQADAAKRLTLLQDHAQRTGYDLSGLTDVRTALRLAAQVHQKKDPLRVALLGAFSGTGAPSEQAKREWDRDAKYWKDNAPEDVAVYWIDGVFPKPMPVSLRGAVEKAWLVLSFEKPRVDAAPWSPFGGMALRAGVTVTVEVLRTGTAGAVSEGLIFGTGATEDQLALHFAEGAQHFVVTRPAILELRETRITFEPWTDDTITLCSLPEPVDIEWTRLEPDAVLTTDDERPVLVHVHEPPVDGDMEAHRFRLLRTRTTPRPAWTTRIETDNEGDGAYTIEVDIGDESNSTDGVTTQTPVTVSVGARRGSPTAAVGTIFLSADGHPTTLQIPFDIRVPAGKAGLRFEGTESARMPPARKDLGFTIALDAQNAYVPTTMKVVAECFPPELASVLCARGADDVVWPLDEPFELEASRLATLRLELRDPEAWRTMSMGMVTLRLQTTTGVEIEGEHRITVEPRRPVLLPKDVAAVPHAIVKKGAFHVETPLQLVVKSDGGDEEWHAARATVPPTVETLEGDAVADWTVTEIVGGVWRIEPTGTPGVQQGIFDDTQAWVKLRVHWPEDVVKSVNYDYEVLVEVPARWGLWGYVMLGLAALALGIGGYAFVQLRMPPVTGTLLYAIDGVDGVVGRLDLRPVGRKSTPVRSDGKGKLHLNGDGELVATVVATRVGGAVEIKGEDKAKDRRLLVDGLAVRTGKHRLRYMSGLPSETEKLVPTMDVPDLLGPEYDLESGRIEAAGNDDETLDGA